MDFKTNNFNIEIPTGWHDQTVYVFTSAAAGKPGQSLVITKEPILTGKDVTMFREILLARLPPELGDIKVLKERTEGLHKQLPMLHLEMQWKSKQYGIMHNHVGAFTMIGYNLKGEKVKQGYVLTLTCLESLYKEENERLFLTTLQSIKS